MLILGARSKMSMAIAHRFAMGGYNIQLAARNAADLNLDRLKLNPKPLECNVAPTQTSLAILTSFFSS